MKTSNKEKDLLIYRAGITEGRLQALADVGEILTKWYWEEMQDVFPLNDFHKLKQKIAKLEKNGRT